MAKVLVVDDDCFMSDLMTEFLSESGHECFSALNGLAGVELFGKIKPDVVVTDIDMPIRNGLWLIEEIRKVDRQVPIIVVSGLDYDSPSNKFESAIELGANICLEKPFAASEFSKAIRGLQQRHSSEM